VNFIPVSLIFLRRHMKLCKCGNPIYDEPDQRVDKCYWCMVKSFKDAVSKNIFMGGRFYETKGDKSNPVGRVMK